MKNRENWKNKMEIVKTYDLENLKETISIKNEETMNV